MCTVLTLCHHLHSTPCSDCETVTGCYWYGQSCERVPDVGSDESALCFRNTEWSSCLRLSLWSPLVLHKHCSEVKEAMRNNIIVQILDPTKCARNVRLQFSTWRCLEWLYTTSLETDVNQINKTSDLLLQLINDIRCAPDCGQTATIHQHSVSIISIRIRPLV